MPGTESPFSVEQRSVEFTADDGVSLVGTWFKPAGEQVVPSTTVLVVCGAGIPARFYYGLARYLAERGAAVLTFDYRGIGASRIGKLRKIKGGMDDWAVRDIAAALTTTTQAYPELTVCVVAHSVGTLLLGAAPGAAQVSHAVLLGAHTGYWRDYRLKWRWPLFVVWHAFMPAITRVFGFFPGRALRLGEDLPRQVAYDWAGRRRPELVRTPRDERRFGPHVHRYAEFTARTLAISTSDDAFAPPAAARRLLAMYPNLAAAHETVTPASIGRRRLGHFGFIRRGSGEYFWRRIAEWLLPSPASTPLERDRIETAQSVGESAPPR